MENLLYDRGNSNLVLSDNLDGWDGVGSLREVQVGEDIHILMTTSWQKPTQYCKEIFLQLIFLKYKIKI